MDQETFICMVRQSQNTYYRVARSILNKEEDAEDAVQEGILKAWQKRNKLKDESLFRTWSTRIVINTCYDMIRKNKPLLFFGEDAPEIPVSGVEGDTDLFLALWDLPPKIRIAVVLHYVEGYTTEEVAFILKIPQGTVKSRLSAVRARLRNALKVDEI